MKRLLRLRLSETLERHWRFQGHSQHLEKTHARVHLVVNGEKGGGGNGGGGGRGGGK